MNPTCLGFSNYIYTLICKNIFQLLPTLNVPSKHFQNPGLGETILPKF